MSNYWSAYSRCNNPSSPSYKRYGGRGIKFYLTENLIKELWFRDKAYLMKQPSLDRKDSNSNYCFSNCRFIEHAENCKNNCKTVQQFTLSGKLIKNWESAAEIERSLGFNRHNINRCCLEKRPTAFGYIWKYIKNK